MHLSSSDKEGMLFSQHLDPLTAPLSRGNSACRDKFDMDNIHDFWPAFSLPTPPTSPVDMCNACHEASKEIGWHLARSPWAELREIEDDELEVNDLPFEGYARELTGLRAKSPAILNDIMWSGDRVKRPDSTTDFLARFSLVSASSSIDQAVNHSLADADELFSCTLTTPCSDQQLTTEALARPESGVSFDFPLYEQSSDTDEDEVDVVGVSLDKTFKTVTSKSDTTKKTENYSNEPPPRKLRSRRNNNCDLSEQESDEGNARISHNDLERKRRNDLRNRFQCLRKCIPLLEDSERVAKITILRRASELIPSLRNEEERLIGLKNNEKKRNAELLNKLMKLTKNKRRQ